MGTREALLQRASVDNDDIDDIIGIAQELQDARTERSERATVDEIRAVADDLDIDPNLVEEAINELGRRREAALEAEAEAKVEADKRSVALKAKLLVVGGVAAAIVVGLVILLVGFAWSGSANIHRAQMQVDSAEVALNVVLERQASLAPQLVALSGAPAGNLGALAQQVRSATTTEDKLAASERLGASLATAMGAMASTASPGGAQQRLDLQHEIVGAQNRISTERRRVDTARTQLRQAQESTGGQLAQALGL